MSQMTYHLKTFSSLRTWLKAVVGVSLGITWGHSNNYTASQYQEVADKSVLFFGAQRSGTEHNWLTQQYSGAKTSFTQDGVVIGRDLSGGWHDAGDFIKFSLTISSSSYGVLKAYEAFPEGFKDEYGPDHSMTPDGIPDILNQAKVASDYLMKIYLNADSVVSRIGGDQDHGTWTTSPLMSGMSADKGGDPRPVYFDTKADIAGLAAASTALMSQLYRSYDADYADSLYDVAVNLFNYAEANRGSTPEPGDNYYLDNNDADNLLCGAVELYRADTSAAQASNYLAKAKTYDAEFSYHGWVVDWANSSDYCRHSLVSAGDTETIKYWKNAVDSYLTKISSDQYVDGLMYLNVEWGTARYAMHAAFSAALYYDQFGGEQYKDFAISQLDYVMGTNEYNRSLIVGFGNNPPTRPHHKNAYGRDVPDWNLSAEPLYVLTGALVGGPTKTDAGGHSTPGYADVITDYVSNEVSIDYNVGLVGASGFAASLGGGTVQSRQKLQQLQAIEFAWDGQALTLSTDIKQWIPYFGNKIDIVKANGQITQRLNLTEKSSTSQTWKLDTLASGAYRVIWGDKTFSFTLQ